MFQKKSLPTPSERQRSSETAITDELADVLAFLDIVVDLLPSFTVRFRRDRIRPTCVVLTDASFATGHKWLGFLVLCPICGALWAFQGAKNNPRADHLEPKIHFSAPFF